MNGTHFIECTFGIRIYVRRLVERDVLWPLFYGTLRQIANILKRKDYIIIDSTDENKNNELNIKCVLLLPSCFSPFRFLSIQLHALLFWF